MNASSMNYYLTNYNIWSTDFWTSAGDQRTLNLPLVSSGPWQCLVIMTAYLVFVTRVGPKWMKNKPAFELRQLMLAYNTAMVVINAFFFVEALRWLNYGKELLRFDFPPKNVLTPAIQRNIFTFYLYYLSKYVDLLDTVFFVLRKKYNQITPLHLYHHTAVPILGWLTIWYRFGVPSISLFALLNSMVHVVMYSYYALAALGPQIQKFLWWKKYITQLQLIQFAIYGFYGTLVMFFGSGYPPLAFWLAFSQPPLFFFLFFDFYRQSYRNYRNKRQMNGHCNGTTANNTMESVSGKID